MMIIPGQVQAESFWDKLKNATQESLKKQQQQQQDSSSLQSAPAAGVSTVIKTYDIQGISLGMSTSEVEQLLRKNYPEYVVFPINYDSYGKKWTGILAAMPKTKHKDEVVLVDFTQPPLKDAAIAITRYKEFPAQATPSLENLEKSLVEKYGEWTSANATTRAGYRKIYNWWTGNAQGTCINDRLSATFGRLREILDEGSLSRVLGDSYGDPGQYVKAFRDYAQFSPQTPVCDKQVTVEINYRPDQSFSPVNKLIVVVADFPAYYDSEVEFSKMATEYRQKTLSESVQRGGIPLPRPYRSRLYQPA